MDITLRSPEDHDLDFLYLVENDASQWRTSLSAGPVSRQSLWRYLHEMSGDLYADGDLRLIIEDVATGMPVGTIDLFDVVARAGRAFVGIYLKPEARGRGIGADAMRHVIDMARRVYGLRMLAATVATDNVASARMFASLGFKLSGTLKAWLPDRGDVDIYQLEL